MHTANLSGVKESVDQDDTSRREEKKGVLLCVLGVMRRECEELRKKMTVPSTVPPSRET